MILTKLTATGFKSFVDKTEFDFGRGITCIVGPNGCGKSNVVDAIKWVLGEQSAKSLRGRQMMDVIFNGCGTRKPAGMCQVDLTFDNTDGRLPTDQTEVVVTRRLYRSGESEYLLNRHPARLKDIKELFLDTGVGVDAYSLIEQGRVDVLLQANPSDRRQIFEEAAGISKYKLRKKEAQRRLERVDQNLLRVQDIVDEVEKRLRSVKLAAGKARNYQSYTQRLRELRSRYALAEYHGQRTQQAELERDIGVVGEDVARCRTEISHNETQSSEANVRIAGLDGEISQGDARLLAVQNQITSQQERASAAERRIADQTDLLERSQNRLSGYEGRVGELLARIEVQQATSREIEAELTEVQKRLAELQEQDRVCSHDLNENQTRLEDEKAGIMDLLRRTSHLHNEIQGLNLQQENLVRQKAKLDERDAEIATALAEALAKQQQLRMRLAEIDQLIHDQKVKLEETKTRASTASEQRAKLLDQLSAAKEYRSGLESRRQVLDEMDRRHEGLLSGAREILQRRDADASGKAFSYVRGAVGELLEADVAHASIVEAVLGHFQKYLVVTERDAFLADREVMAEFGGRVEAFCLSHVAPAVAGPDMSGHDGFIANLIDWVRYPDDCSKLARYLLGRIYVVESLAHARHMAEIDPGACFVTMEGVVWEADGHIGVGSLGSDTGLISRRSELRELARELITVQERIANLTASLQRCEAEVDHLEHVQQDLRTAIYEANTERVEAQTQLNGVDDIVRRHSEERPIIAAEVSVLVSRLQEAQEKEAAGKELLTQLEHRNNESERVIQELQQALEQLRARRTEISEQLTTARVRSGELNQRRTAVFDAVRQLQETHRQLQAERDKAAADVVEAQQRIEQSQRQVADARQALGTLAVEQEDLMARSRELRGLRDDLRTTIDQCSTAIRQLRGQLEQAEARFHERQIKLQEVRIRQEDLVKRIIDELGVNLEAQYESYVPEESENWPAVEAEIEEIRAKIERLGNVNLDAIDEQAELEKRLEFLTTQYNDLKTSAKQLQELIDKLNQESQERFLVTFKRIQENFSALFKKLFGGGKAEINLLDSNDVLESGIEITARPPGKEPQSISLLSGGEKTMTAIALLLAVMRNRPAPFVLMDEVDAALDEANNIRFNHVIQEFLKESQFIVITHAKRTMSIADVMYGITMQEAGVSKRVSVRFEDERRAQPAVA